MEAMEQLHSPRSTSEIRIQAGRVTGLLAILTALFAGYNFIFPYGADFKIPYTGVLFTGITGILVLITVLLLHPSVVPLVGRRFENDWDATRFFSLARTPFGKVRLTWYHLLIIVVSLVALGFLGDYGRRYYPNVPITPELPNMVQMLLFWGGILGLLFGFGVFAGFNLRRVRDWPRLQVGLLVLCIAVGFAVRVYRLGDLVHIMIDEDHYYIGLLNLINRPTMPVFDQIGGLASLPHLLPWFQLPILNIFGVGFDAIRIPTMVFGVLTIPAVYLLGRALFDWKLGIMAAAFLAVFPPHMHFSRLVLFNTPDTFFGTLAIAFVALSLRYNRQRDYAFAGVCLGLSGLFYEGGRLLYLAVAVIFMGFSIVTRPGLLRNWRGFLILLIGYAAVSFPYLWVISRGDVFFTPRLSMEGVRLQYMTKDIQGGKPILDVLVQHWSDAMQWTFYHTIYSPDRSQFYYGGKTGILFWYLVPFYFLGLFYLLFRVFRVGIIFWAWICGAIVGISLVVSTDWTVRFLVMFPAMSILTMAGLRYLIEDIWLPRWNRQVLWGALTVAIVLVGSYDVYYYFNEHLPFYNLQVRKDIDFYDAFYTISFKPKTNLYYVGVSPQRVFSPVLDHDIALRQIDITYAVIEKPEDLTPTWFANLDRKIPQAFAIEPSNLELAKKIKDAFPNIEGPLPGLVDTVPPDKRYFVFWLPAATP
jgi:hypothetical protein